MNQPFEIILSYQLMNKGIDSHEYRLNVRLKNIGTETISRYHVDLKMPAQVVREDELMHFDYIPKQSNKGEALLRFVCKRNEYHLYPGDETVLTHNYFVSGIDRQLLDQIVLVTAYREDGGTPATVQCPFKDMLEL